MSMMRVGLVLLVAGVAMGGTPEGLAALEKGDYRTAMKEFQAGAKEGDAEAEYQLGELYRLGRGASVSVPLATKCYEQALAQGHANAGARLGCMLWDGRKDRARAATLLRKAAEDGSVIAQYKLALVGTVAGLTEEQELEWLAKAAESGHADAQYRYGLEFKEGKRVTASAEDALVWLRKAAEQGHPEAHREIAALLADRKEVSEAFEWYRKGALLGDFYSQWMLGMAYLQNENITESYAWMLVASDPKNSWPETNEIGVMAYKKFGKIARDTAKKLKSSQNPESIKKGAALADEYEKTIKESLAKGLPW